MDTLEQQLHDRMHRAGAAIAVPAADPADDVRRGRAGLRRQRAVTVGGAALAVAAVAGGAVSVAGDGDDARSIDPAAPAGSATPSASSTPDPRTPEGTFLERVEGTGTEGPGRSEGFTFLPEQVGDAVADYEAAVLAGLDPQGPDGGPDLVALTQDHLMQGEAVFSGDSTVRFTMDPSFLGADFVLRTPEGRSSLTLDVEDIPLRQERAEEQPPEGGWDDSCGGEGLVCHEVDLDRDDVVKARYLERDGQLIGAIVDKANGETVSLVQVNDVDHPEPPLPWTSDDLIAVLVDPALTLPHVR